MVILKKILLWFVLGIVFGVGFHIVDRNFGTVGMVVVYPDGTSELIDIPKKDLDV